MATYITKDQQESARQPRFIVDPVAASISARRFVKRQRSVMNIVEQLIKGSDQAIVLASNSASMLKEVQSLAEFFGAEVETVSESKIRVGTATCEEVRINQDAAHGPTGIYGATLDENGNIQLKD